MPFGSGVPTVAGRDRLLVSSAGFSVSPLPLGQGWKASDVGKI